MIAMLRWLPAFGLAVAMLTEGGVGIASAKTFPDVRQIETRLVRNVSTREDVLALLGQPDGSGGAVLPPNYRPLEVLYYEDIELGHIETSDEALSTDLRASMRQQILLIFLDGDRFVGFSWSSNAIPANSK